MTTQEFSDMFDVLLSSYNHLPIFGEQASRLEVTLNEYEKSVYLTQALELLIIELYSNKYSADSFENTEELRRLLDSLVKTNYPTEITSETLTDRFIHTSYTIPEDCWYIVYELCQFSDESNKCLDGKTIDITPVTHDSYLRTIRNPFRGPNKRKVLRLDTGKLQVELVSSTPINNYLIRYVSKPKPIILCDLESDNLEIGSYNKPLTCELTEQLHLIILNRAVLAALSKASIKQKS